MGSFQRAFLGYRRPEVDAAISARDARIAELSRAAMDREELARHSELLAQKSAELEAELGSLSGMVIEREREIRSLGEQLREANERHERSIASLEAVTARLGEIEAQARGQATRIRMKALREAVEVGRRAQELASAEENGAPAEGSAPGEDSRPPLFEGPVRVEIGPLGDYSQLVGLEDAIGEIGAAEISIERFSEGRATLSVRLDEPVDLLRELEERSPLDFRVRRAADDNLVLDVDEDEGHENRAA